MSCPTFSSTDIFFNILSAAFQDFSEGSNFFIVWSRFDAAKTTELKESKIAKNKLIINFICIVGKNKTCDKSDRQGRQAADDRIPRKRDFRTEINIEHQRDACQHGNQRAGLIGFFNKSSDQKNAQNRSVNQSGDAECLIQC